MKKCFSLSLLSLAVGLALLTSSYSAIAASSETPANPDQASEILQRRGQSLLTDSIIPVATASNPTVVEQPDPKQKTATERLQAAPTANYDVAKLIANPDAFSESLSKAVSKKDVAAIKALLPQYKLLETRDLLLIKVAEAIVLRDEKQYKPAIAAYGDILLEDPDNHAIRLDLALALQADKQYLAAEDQLRLLLAADIPKVLKSRAEKALTQIAKTEDWRFNVSIRNDNDSNINGAPPAYIQNQFGRNIEKKSGNGVRLTGSANKRINLPKNYYAVLGANASLKAYWDASDYNDYLFTALVGAGYDDAKHDLSISPFMTKRIFNEATYSSRTGVNVRGSKWITSKVKLTASSSFSNETFENDTNNRRETNGQSIGLNAYYSKDSKQYFVGGLSTYRNEVAKSVTSSYDRDLFNIGWNRRWDKGISTLASVGYNIKNYDKNIGASKRYFESLGAEYGAQRTDKTTSLRLQVSKQGLTWYGLEPRLLLDYSKTSSNFAYYDDRKERSATLLLSKRF
ncbi:surface lipoprotein assembly modifier [Psychrobacter pygoscelis]|uniref:surface lipoprotein assembly modifier n=1 Tax=Psychrobacter pygoscelis TaxID=2488563 RepID=UPI00103D4E8B|nr:surface lipoprotein assembly modifier [Psychrobacter pygoscelis]